MLMPIHFMDDAPKDGTVIVGLIKTTGYYIKWYNKAWIKTDFTGDLIGERIHPKIWVRNVTELRALRNEFPVYGI